MYWEIIYEKQSSIFPVHSSDNNSLKELKLIKTGQIQFTGHTQSYPWKRNTEVSISVEKFRDQVHAKRSRHGVRTWWTEAGRTSPLVYVSPAFLFSVHALLPEYTAYTQSAASSVCNTHWPICKVILLHPGFIFSNYFYFNYYGCI